MNEARFWSMIEAAWQVSTPEHNASRHTLVEERDEEAREALAYELEGAVAPMVQALGDALEALEREILLGFDRVIERLMYALDREDIHDVTDGSDDGFLYARGFILAMGRAYCEAVLEDPSKAVPDVECMDLPYIALNLFAERFGEDAWTPTSISRESCSNARGWGRDPEAEHNVRGNLLP